MSYTNGKLFSTILLCVIYHFGRNSMILGDLMDLIGEARCASRCFQEFKKSLTEQGQLYLLQHPNMTQAFCINHKGDCTLCLEVCRWPRNHSNHCENTCNSLVISSTSQRLPEVIKPKESCLDSCKFAARVYHDSDILLRQSSTKSCPRTEHWPSNCDKICQTDQDCDPMRIERCCATKHCSPSKDHLDTAVEPRVCIPSVITTSGTPSVPGQPSVIQTDSSMDELNHAAHLQLELDWSNYYNHSEQQALPDWGTQQYPAVFLIQVRMFEQLKPDWKELKLTDRTESNGKNLDNQFSSWKNLVWTTKLGAELSDLNPGTWYQFRLGAVSVAGLGGWGQPSRAIYVQSQPQMEIKHEPPSSPLNLTEYKSRIFDNHVDVTIEWQRPMTSPLPPTGYQITWRRYYGSDGGDTSSFTAYEAKISSDDTQYTILKLKSGVSYKIEVKTISVFNGKEFMSYPSSLYITTLQIPPRHGRTSGSNHQSDINESCRCDGSGSSTQSDLTGAVHSISTDSGPKITVGKPFYENEDLKVDIKFQPEKMSFMIQPTLYYTVNWKAQVCIATHSGRYASFLMDYVPHKHTILGSELGQFRLTGLQFQCHYSLSIEMEPPELKKSPSSGTKQALFIYRTCFCTPSCHQLLVTAGPPPTNCTLPAVMSQLKPMRLSYTVVPEAQKQKGSNLVNGYKQRPTKASVDDTRTNPNSTYDAIVMWHPFDSRETQSYTPSTHSDMRTLTARQTTGIAPTPVRGVRVTWGPRLFEPVDFRLYDRGLWPLLDPNKMQSKVLHPRSSSLLLKGLQKETLYIVHVQLVGTRTDGPVSTIFFATPGIKQTHSRGMNLSGPSYQILIILLCLQLLR